ncbi:MAG: phosphoethanolamine transferase [Steroidobacteraceae bacterium]
MPQKARFSLFVLAILCAAPALAAAVCATRFQTPRSVVTILLVTALEAILIAALTRTWRRFFLANFFVFLLSVAFTAYTLWFGVPPGRHLAMTLVSTSWEEVVGFVSLSQGRTILLACVLLPLLFIFLTLRLPNVSMFSGKPLIVAGRTLTRSRIMLILCLPVTAYAAWNPADLIDGIAYNPVIGSAMFLGGQIPRARADARGALLMKVPYRAQRVGGEEVHILVIGESARRESWSAYGYGRITTPHLDSLKSATILLQNAVADANLTAWSVPVILTGMTPDQLDSTPVRGNLLDLAKEAGYSTTWLLNQDIGISHFVGVHADHLTYSQEIETSLFGRRTLDETLLPAYRNEMARPGSPRFIGVHIMGSHWEYKHRYPESFQRFGDARRIGALPMFTTKENASQSVVDAYDNTILYTDWFLYQLIQAAQALQVPATLTYFPDHGEDLQLLDGDEGHGGPKYTPHVFEIPAFIWMNAAYRREHPQKVAALQANASREIRSHDVFNTVADLMGIKWPQFVAQRSFASEQFTPDSTTPLLAGSQLVSRPTPTQ